MEIIFVIVLLCLCLGAGNKIQKASCRVCGWRGSRKLWNQHRGCPNCRTDESPDEYRE